jgi:hypothetical protein
MWSEQDLNFQPRFSSARRQPIVPFSVREFKELAAELGNAHLRA